MSEPTPQNTPEERVEESGNPLVSVVLVSYNTRLLTLRALETLYSDIESVSFNVEVIVVDNNSHDGSPEAIAGAYPEAILIRSGENLGFGRGNNLGASSATGSFLFFLNTDTETKSGALASLVEVAGGSDEVGAVGARLEYPDGSDQDSIILVPRLWRIFCEFFWLDRINHRLFSSVVLNQVDREKLQRIEAAHGAALMVCRALFERVGAFDPDYFMYFEEADLCTRIREAGYTIFYVPGARIMHHVSASSSTRPWWLFRAMRVSRRTFARKHLPAWQRPLIEIIVHTGYLVRMLLFTLVGIVNPRLLDLGRQMFRSYADRSGPDREKVESPA